ncbi:MAG: thiopurine S-methyltransferase [Deltaproteobacteria bacterium]|nr:MAG: thiopurine S-methyltransferase [Deltaproteobacteria bacterium]
MGDDTADAAGADDDDGVHGRAPRMMGGRRVAKGRGVANGGARARVRVDGGGWRRTMDPAMTHSDPASPEFWRRRWREGRCGWHKDDVNEKLRRYVGRLSPAPGRRVLVPLCGASLDLGFLADAGFEPVGVEVVEDAVARLFPGAEPDASAGTVHTRDGVTVVCGDFFACDLSPFAPFAAFYDRGALVAIPPRLREAYARRIEELVAKGARGLVVTVAYDGPADVGPPFSVPAAEIERLFGGAFEVEVLESVPDASMPGSFADHGVTNFSEGAYLLTRRGS